MRARKTAMEAAVQKSTRAPCADCKRRAVGCHSACPDYSEYKKQVSAARCEIMNRNRADMINDRYKGDKCVRILRKEQRK